MVPAPGPGIAAAVTDEPRFVRAGDLDALEGSGSAAEGADPPKDPAPADEGQPTEAARPTPSTAEASDAQDADAPTTPREAAGRGGALADDASADGGQPWLSTGCGALDRLLDGGLERDAITLVFGEGGSGKTNLALQVARQVTATGKKVAYVDTEGVSPRRLEQVFEAEPAAEDGRILFFTPFSIDEQEQMVAKTALLRGVGLIIIDSINMHYRLHIEDKASEREASKSLFKQLHHLTGHARKHGIPVLVTGQVFGVEDDTQPFARRVMEHMVKALVRFQKKPDGSRKATVLKHRSIEEGRSARFAIGPHGLVDA